ncbi:Bax inhibitor-1/YccA family protein [Isoptericola sp. b441]|uniref:Bax inhibitor-1/YccA family protein n=1 Tax=Actinotalea lenta TaxID=3064654 RepID=A0ABT9D7J7_9CELL|nr:MULTISPECIES: Bax inhibitor-1/YccA family protein [unclassified Isoptericola]MDO8106834.1 Bax inhibitor-1/YccA family protein [Isoptericola sp. b441]MDO8121455.1 Bax inhibitor-1/YccA family protein [Isoptericola sp. b490]
MANPVFSSSEIFGEPRRGRAGTAAYGGPRAAQTGATAQAGMDAATLEQMYGAPSATTRDTARLTYDDVIVKTGGLLALLVAVAAATWYLAPGLFWVGMIAGLVLGLVNAFKREPSPALIVAYTVAEGVFLGGISYLFQSMTFNGTAVQPIVLQAVLGTFATFGAALALYSSGKVRVTPKFTRWLMIAMVGYLAFSVLNIVLSFFMPSSGFGPLREGGMGLLVGLFAVGLAAAMLIVDFDNIKRGVQRGAPARYAWSAAFGLIVTLVWLYLEILRILAIFNRN